jgi:hypothetical protein
MASFSARLVCVSAALVACGATSERPKVPGAGGITLSEDAAPAGYAELGQVSAQSGEGCGMLGHAGSRAEAEAKLRDEAGKLGATFVRLTDIRQPGPNHQCLEHEYKLTGVAYRAASATPAPASAATAAPPAPSSSAMALAPAAVPARATGAVVQDYEPGAPQSVASENTAESRLNLTLAPGELQGNALSVDYGCSAAEQRALLDVWSTPLTRDWSKAAALSLRVKPDSALALSVSFMDANHAGYTQATPTLTPGVWQTVSLPFEKFWLNPHGPQGDKPGAPLDLSQVERFGFAPQGCVNGHFLIDDFRLSP